MPSFRPSRAPRSRTTWTRSTRSSRKTSFGAITTAFRRSACLTGRGAISAHIAERKAFYSASRFDEVVYHRLPEASFMTFRVSETVRATGEQREQRGIERYRFADGKLATKDVYRKPVAG